MYMTYDAYVRNILLILPNSFTFFGIFIPKKVKEFDDLMDSTPIFLKKIINIFGKYIKKNYNYNYNYN